MEDAMLPSVLSSVDNSQSLIPTRPPDGQELTSHQPFTGGLSNVQIEQLLSTIKDLQFENNDLRNTLDEANNLMQAKLQMLRDMDETSKAWAEKMREKHKKTSEYMRKLRKEKKNLEEQMREMQLSGGMANSNQGYKPSEGTAKKLIAGLQRELQEAAIRIERLEKEKMQNPTGYPASSAQELHNLANQLKAEAAKSKSLTLDLQKSGEAQEKLEKQLRQTTEEFTKSKETHRRDFQMLRARMDESLSNNQKEITNYKQQITSVLNELKDKDKIITTQRSKMTELHKANNEFDSLTKALQSKLSMYDEQLDRFQVDRQSSEKRYNTQVMYLKNQLQQEQHRSHTDLNDKQRLEKTYQELKKEKEKFYQENWKLKNEVRVMSDDLGRVAAEKISLEESLEARSNDISRLKKDIKDLQMEDRLLREQINHFQRDFQAERSAKERNHQVIQECQQQLQVLRDKNAHLEREVDQHNQEQLRQMQDRMERQYSSNYAVYNPGPPSPGMYAQSYDQPMRNQEWGMNRNSDAEQQQEFSCPKCGEKYAEMESLTIHVQDCIQ